MKEPTYRFIVRILLLVAWMLAKRDKELAEKISALSRDILAASYRDAEFLFTDKPGSEPEQ